jgi:hypothetical protein
MSNSQYFGQETFFNEKINAYAGISGDLTGNVIGNLTGDITGNVIGNLTGNLTGDITGDILGNVTGNITSSGISTFQDIRIIGKYFDGSNTFGSSGQILSSDGTKTAWINASSASVGSATSVGTNLDSTNVSRYLTFVENTSGNNIIRVDSDLTYNPSTNTFGNIQTGILTASALKITNGLYDGSNSLGSSGQILSSNGSATLWINASSANVGSATSIGINLDSTNASRYLTFVDATSGNNLVKVDADLTYNPSTNALTAGSFVKSGGTSSQFLKADGSVDSTTYSTQTFPSGTLMLFQQTAAPTGWTKQTTHNNKALRVVSGTASSGGTTAFTTVFASRTPAGTVSGTNSGGSVTGSVSGSNSGGSVSNTTLVESQIPSHTHSYTASNNNNENRVSSPKAGNVAPVNTGTFGANTAAAGGGGAHSHGFTNPSWSGTWTQGVFTNPSWSGSFSGTALDFAVQYVDLIIASKD